MFQLRLKDGQVLGLGIHKGGVKLSISKTLRWTPMIVDLVPSELSLVAKALEVTRRVLAGGATAKPPRVLEFQPSVGSGQVQMFVPQAAEYNGEIAVLWVSNGTGRDSAVFLSQADLERVADWAYATAQFMRLQAVVEEGEIVGEAADL